MHRVVGQRPVVQWAFRKPDLRQIAFAELVSVDDDLSARLEQRQAGHQSRRVHRDQNVGGVAGGENVVVGEVQLESTDARQRALRGTDLRREVGQCGQVVAARRGFPGETVAGQLHAVAGVTGESHDDAVQTHRLLRTSCQRSILVRTARVGGLRRVMRDQATSTPSRGMHTVKPNSPHTERIRRVTVGGHATRGDQPSRDWLAARERSTVLMAANHFLPRANHSR